MKAGTAIVGVLALGALGAAAYFWYTKQQNANADLPFGQDAPGHAYARPVYAGGPTPGVSMYTQPLPVVTDSPSLSGGSLSPNIGDLAQSVEYA